MASYGDMAFAVSNQERVIKGLRWPASTSGAGGTFSNNYNTESIKDGLIQLLLTSRGERPMRLDFGTDLRRSVFAPLDSATISALKASINTAIKKYEKRITVRSLEVTPRNDNSQVDVALSFSLKDNVLDVDRIFLTVNTEGVIING